MKKLLYLFALCLPALAWLPGATRGEEKKKAEYKPFGSVERKDPRFDKLIAPTVKAMEDLADGFDWSEGPVWVNKDGGYLLCSDIPKNQVVKWQEGKGKSVFLHPSGYYGKETYYKEPGSNGLLLDSEGRLILMQHGERAVARLEKDGKTLTKLVDNYKGTRLNSPNDGAFLKNGDLYFTDPPYGLMRKDMEGFPGQNLDFQGIYRLTPKGELTLLNKEMTKPNGIAFSPDEKTLYVSNSDPKVAVWMKFPVKEDGTLGEGKVFFDATPLAGKLKGLPDGMKVDRDGNIFATGPGGVLVFAPDGTHLGTLLTNVPTANCNWGDDGSTLYITADKNLIRIKTLTKGKGF
jgi:gluconolactonase